MSEKSNSFIKQPISFPPVYVKQYSGNNNSSWFNGVFNEEKMSQSNDERLQSANHLSWRKMQLSRAKLKASSKTSALLSGFAMVALVELDLNNEVDHGILIAFSICTTLLISVHMLALLISTCILPNIEAICSFESDARDLIHESPHERLHWFIEISWLFSTVFGIFLFLLEIAILFMLKFEKVLEAAWTGCGIICGVVIIFVVFAVLFYRSIISHKCDVTFLEMKELERIKERIDCTSGGSSDKPLGIYYKIETV